jgi:hypothetical protein
MTIRCNICNADPAGRWTSPPARIFCDPYREHSSARDEPALERLKADLPACVEPRPDRNANVTFRVA